MTSTRLLILSAISALLAPQCLAQSTANDAAYTKAMNNLSHEYTICAAYYTIIAQCLGNEAKGVELSKSYRENAEILLDRAMILGKEVGLKNEAVTARLQIAFDEQMTSIDNNCINNSILYSRHAERCRRIAEDFEGAFQGYYDSATRELSQ